ncbi:MAG: helix-turn-helix domain-containing protein [Candidatus Heimdallarchaeota archaeon]|nr:MAG: helix-turn-helix domain-containing protein [Candidatus Heimdallarchaeota archaeon]
MIQTNLQISSKDYYLCELTKRIPVKVTIVTIRLPEGYGFIEALEGGEKTIQTYVDSVKASGSVRDFEVTSSSPTIYFTRSEHDLDYPSIYETILESGSMSLLPIIIVKGVQYHTVYSPSREALKALLDTLKLRFTTVKIVSLTSTPFKSKGTLLTPKQLEAFELAFKKGYYEIPRRSKITIESLARDIGIKRVAMQERLRRAEQRILSDYANRNLQ